MKLTKKDKESPHKAKSLSPSEKRVIAKSMLNLGWGSRKVGEWLGISKDTVLRSRDIPTPENMRQFEAEFEDAIKSIRSELRATLYMKILELIPEEKKLDRLVKVGEFLEGKKTQSVMAYQYDYRNIGTDIAEERKKRGFTSGV